MRLRTHRAQVATQRINDTAEQSVNSRRITHAVARLDDARLDAPFPDEAYREVFPTVRHALTQVLVGHTANHVGQLTVWRRAMGLPRVARSFE